MLGARSTCVLAARSRGAALLVSARCSRRTSIKNRLTALNARTRGKRARRRFFHRRRSRSLVHGTGAGLRHHHAASRRRRRSRGLGLGFCGGRCNRRRSFRSGGRNFRRGSSRGHWRFCNRSCGCSRCRCFDGSLWMCRRSDGSSHRGSRNIRSRWSSCGSLRCRFLGGTLLLFLCRGSGRFCDSCARMRRYNNDRPRGRAGWGLCHHRSAGRTRCNCGRRWWPNDRRCRARLRNYLARCGGSGGSGRSCRSSRCWLGFRGSRMRRRLCRRGRRRRCRWLGRHVWTARIFLVLFLLCQNRLQHIARFGNV
jgi:hypothetical protein